MDSQAVKGFNKVMDYLEAEWTAKDILNLENKIQQVINQININPEQFPKSIKSKSLYKAIVDKNNYLVYKLMSSPILLRLSILEKQNKSLSTK